MWAHAVQRLVTPEPIRMMGILCVLQAPAICTALVPSASHLVSERCAHPTVSRRQRAARGWHRQSPWREINDAGEACRHIGITLGPARDTIPSCTAHQRMRPFQRMLLEGAACACAPPWVSLSSAETAQGSSVWLGRALAHASRGIALTSRKLAQLEVPRTSVRVGLNDNCGAQGR